MKNGLLVTGLCAAAFALAPGGASAAIIVGTPGSDVLIGTSEPDHILCGR